MRKLASSSIEEANFFLLTVPLLHASALEPLVLSRPRVKPFVAPERPLPAGVLGQGVFAMDAFLRDKAAHRFRRNEGSRVTDKLKNLKFDDQGLIPAIVQDGLTGEVRMMAWMNEESLQLTLSTRRATFYSRSRAKLWMKGEESGNTLAVSNVLADCDGDTLLVLCDPAGPSCHTGRDNCFFVPLDGGEEHSAKPILDRLEDVLETRKTSTGEKSYTRSLFDGGAEKIGGKIIEEAGEVVEALKNETDDRVTSEAADVLFHVLVGLRSRGIRFRTVLEVLAKRFGVGGHVEKNSRR